MSRTQPCTARRTLWVGGVLAAAAVTSVAMLTRPFAAPRRPGRLAHPLSIYDPDAADVPVVSPFHLDTEPMRALALFNFERDPDTVYKGLEPQAFDDEEHGRGLLVIGWRVDGRVDVLHDPGLRLNAAGYSIAGGGLHRMEPRDLSGGRFEIGPAGLSVDLEFTDVEDRPIRLVVDETDTRPRRPFALLAPMGSVATDPPALPLVYVKDFYFVRRAGSEIRIEIDGRTHRSDTVPLLLDGTWMHFVRYSATPLIAQWNHRRHQTAGIVVPASGTGSSAAIRPDVSGADGTRFDLSANGPFHEIHRMTRREGDQQVSVEFTPAFPHLLALRDGTRVVGSFRVTTEPAAGTVTGTWQITRRGDRIDIEAVPSGGWTPGDVPPMARVLFRIVTMFRSWPTTYRWNATIELPDDHDHDHDHDHPPTIRSGWERIR